MKRYQPTFKTQVIKEDAEDDKSVKAIKDLIDLNWGEDEDHQNTALQLIKGLIYANTPTADKFIQDLSDYTSKMKVEDFKEGCKKKPKKKGMKEDIRVLNKDQAFEAISEGVNFLIQTNSRTLMQGYLINAIIDGLKAESDDEDDEMVFNKRLSFIIKELKDQLR